MYLPKIAPKYLPMLIMGAASILGGFLALFLPETLGTLLPESMEDIDVLKQNKKGFFQCYSKTKLKAKMEELEKAKKKSRF